VKKREELGVEPDEIGVGTPSVSESEQTSSLKNRACQGEETPSMSARRDTERVNETEET
jgi:hypothetical protein